MRYRLTYRYKGRAQYPKPFDAASDEAASDIVKLKVNDLEAEGGYTNYIFFRILQEEQRLMLPIPGLHDSLATCGGCGSYLIRSGDSYKCTNCLGSNIILTIS